MTVSILPPAYTTFFDDDGVPVGLGSLYTYVVGTTTPKTTWQDIGGTITNANPILLDAAGRCLCWGTGNYRTILKDAAGNTIWDRDTTGFQAVTVYTISPSDYGGDPTGIVNSTTAINSASVAAIAQGKPLVLNGVYLSSGAVLINAPLTVLAGAAFIQNSTLAINGAILAAPGDYIFRGVGTVTLGAGATPDVYPEWWGAAGDGATNDSTSIQAALTAATHATTRLSGVSYAITTGLTLPVNTTIIGAGRNLTIIVPTTLNMVAMSLVSGAAVDANISISGMAFAPTVAGVSAVKFTFCSYTAVENVTFTGCAKTVVIDRGQFHLVENCVSAASASRDAGQLVIWSSTDTQTTTPGDQYVYFATVRSYGITRGTQHVVDPACFFRRCVGCIFDSIQGIHVSSGSPGTGLIALENDSQGNKFLNCTADATSYLILLQPGTGAVISPSYTEITSCDGDFFYSAAIWSAGTAAAPVTFLRISGGYFTAPQAAGAICLYATYTSEVTISGVQIYNYLATLGIGIKLDHCNIVAITESSFTAMTTGLEFGTGNTNVHVYDNWFGANGANIVDTVSGGFNRITNNSGVNPPAIGTPAIPATTVPYTNTQGYDLRVAVSGTVTVIAVNGVVTGLTSGMFQVNTGENITITHTAGAWAWVPL